MFLDFRMSIFENDRTKHFGIYSERTKRLSPIKFEIYLLLETPFDPYEDFKAESIINCTLRRR